MQNLVRTGCRVVSLAVFLYGQASAQNIEWEPAWNFLQDCGGFRFEYRVSKSPANERLGFRVINNTGDSAAGNAQIQVLRDDGSFTGVSPLIAGSLPSGGYEAWLPPGTTKELPDIDVSGHNPHPITGVRAAGAALHLVDIAVMTKTQYQTIVTKAPNAYHSMKEGKVCEKVETSFGWRNLSVSQRGSDGKSYTLTQQIFRGKSGGVDIHLVVHDNSLQVYSVTARIPAGELKKISVDASGVQELSFGKYTCVDVACSKELFELSATDGQTNKDSTGLLYFRTDKEAKQAVVELKRMNAEGG